MSLLQALAFPLRNPLRFVLLAGVHYLTWSILRAGLDYSNRYPGRLESTTVVILIVVLPILYSIWLHRRAIASLRRLFSGGRTLPPLSISDFVPLRIRSVFSTSLMFIFVAIYVLVIQALRFDLQAHLVAIDAVEVFEAVHLLARFGVTFVALTLLTVLFIVGLARYATEGASRKVAHLIAEELGLPNNRCRSSQYVLIQLLMLGGAMYLLELGVLLDDAVGPLIQSLSLDGGMAWQTFCMFAFACGFVLFWNASLHLLAQYAAAIGIRHDGHEPTKEKGKRDFTRESAGA
ncbi:MAG: hypothetical protein OXG53_13515 [Chloroflexi bacterium]|nr:hypothetical protein [Chloroflexota bacterium]